MWSLRVELERRTSLDFDEFIANFTAWLPTAAATLFDNSPSRQETLLRATPFNSWIYCNLGRIQLLARILLLTGKFTIKVLLRIGCIQAKFICWIGFNFIKALPAASCRDSALGRLKAPSTLSCQVAQLNWLFGQVIRDVRVDSHPLRCRDCRKSGVCAGLLLSLLFNQGASAHTSSLIHSVSMHRAIYACFVFVFRQVC